MVKLNNSYMSLVEIFPVPKKKYQEEQNKIQSQSEVQSEVVPSDLHVRRT
jgi:hypothetical protein